MKFKTALTLFIGFFNAVWLLHVFTVLLLSGHYPISEPNRWMAGLEIGICLLLAGMFIERLLRLKERS